MNPIQPMYEHSNLNLNSSGLQGHYQPSSSQPPLPFQPQSPQNFTPLVSNRVKKDRACDLCRRKKVKCDYDYMNPHFSCNSCKSYGKACTFNEAAKKRGPPKGYVEKLENRLKRIENTLTNIAKSGNLPQELLNEVLDTTNTTDTTDTISTSSNNKKKKMKMKTKTDSDEQKATTLNNSNHNHDNNRDSEILEITKKPLSYVGSSSGFYMLNKLFSQSTVPVFRDTSSFSQALDGHEDDMMALRLQFDTRLYTPQNNPEWKLPPKELVDYLIKVFFTHLNTLLPIIDEEVFYSNYQHGINQEQMPLIVSICLATCRSLKRDHPLLKKFNIDSVNLFKDLLKQISDYFNLDILSPDIQTIQIILLWASNAEKWELESHHWLLTSIAVKMAQDLGLHRSNTNSKHIAKKDIESKKRLWWSIVCIDRWVSAALGRPLTISDADCDVEFPDTEATKYSIFLQMVKLSCILGDALRSFCSPRSRFLSENGIGLEQVSSDLEQLLQEWKYSLPADLNLTDEELSRISRGKSDPDLTLKINNGAGRLFLCYYTVFLIIKRPVLVSLKQTVTLPPECQNAVRILVHLFDAIDATQLLCGWSLSSHCISQVQTILFLYHINDRSEIQLENNILKDVFKRFHLRLSEYVNERSIVPFLDALSKVLEESDDSSKIHGESMVERTNAISLHQSHLWNMSSNIEWQEMVKLLAETDYQS